MPSASKKQHNFMEAVAHGMKPRNGGPSVKVAKEFAAADKGKKFCAGGGMRRGGAVKCSTPQPW
jgi:hypothetical protein